MYLLTTNAKRELVYLAYAGHVDQADAKRCGAEIAALLPTLRPGFCLLTDLSALEQMDYACAQELRVTMEEFRKAGVSRVVRVIPDHKKDIGFTLMSYFHYGHGISIQTVESLAEALQLIDS